MTSNSTISETECTLLQYLGQSLKPGGACNIRDLSAGQAERLYKLAERHEVSVLLRYILKPDSLPAKLQNDFEFKTARTVHKGIRLQSLNGRLTALLEKNGIQAVTMKGYAVARFYPVPEFRKTTDIDLFVPDKKDAEKAGRILCEHGFKYSTEHHADYHIVLISDKNETVELHTAWAGEFKDKRLKERLDRLQQESIGHCAPTECGGTRLCVYETAWQAFCLLIHMMHHFVGSGFGLRNLCDWVVLWENCGDSKAREDFRKLVCESGTAEFAGAVNSICVEYLGLTQAKSPFAEGRLAEKDITDALLRDVLDAGEFGYSEPDRMVGMDGNSPAAYIKEFHHQMNMNFPKAGRVILFWPALWLATLIRFLRNNKRLSRPPLHAIIKKAGSRGELVKRLTTTK